MIPQFVLDASVVGGWWFADEKTAFTEDVADALRCRRLWALTTEVWPSEVANMLLNAQRAGRIDAERPEAFLHFVGSLPISHESTSQAALYHVVRPLGFRLGLTAYDAAYLHLAQRHGVSLATLDGALQTAARHEGVPLIADLRDFIS